MVARVGIPVIVLASSVLGACGSWTRGGSATDSTVQYRGNECQAPDTPKPTGRENLAMGELEVGQTVRRIVWARPKWNHLGIHVVADQEYAFTASGTWWDCGILARPSGYTSDEVVHQGASRYAFNGLTESWRRLPSANWFALVCGVDDDPSTYFAVGAGTRRQAPASGMLGCFANDLTLFYGNNSGAVMLSVTRTR